MWPRCIKNVTKVVRYEKYDLCETKYMLYINRYYHKFIIQTLLFHLYPKTTRILYIFIARSYKIWIFLFFKNSIIEILNFLLFGFECIISILFVRDEGLNI